MEEGGTHIAKAAAETAHQQNMEETPQHEAAENGHSVINGVTQGSSNQSAATVIDIQGNKKTTGIQEKEVAERGNGHLERGVITGESSNESAKRSLELPLF